MNSKPEFPWWIRFISALISWRIPILLALAVVAVVLIAGAAYVPTGYPMSVMIEVGAAMMLVVALDIPLEFSNKLSKLDFKARLCLLPLGVGAVIGAYWVDDEYTQSLMIEAGAGIVLFVLIGAVLEAMRRAAAREAVKAKWIADCARRMRDGLTVDFKLFDHDDDEAYWFGHRVVPEGYIDDPEWERAWLESVESDTRLRQLAVARHITRHTVLAHCAKRQGMDYKAVEAMGEWTADFDSAALMRELEMQLGIVILPGVKDKITSPGALINAVLESSSLSDAGGSNQQS